MKLCTIPGCAKPLSRHGLCQMHNWRLVHHGDVHHRRAPPPPCAIVGCTRPLKGHGLCMLHLGRRRRGLPSDYTPPPLPRKRYRARVLRGHPLADARGRVYAHRVALYDSIPVDPIPCFWCGAPLTWGVDLFVDHLNHDRHDNAPTNLVPACNGCNAGRTSANPRIRQSVYSVEFVWDGTKEKVGT